MGGLKGGSMASTAAVNSIGGRGRNRPNMGAAAGGKSKESWGLRSGGFKSCFGDWGG